jgi:hypothetical protein
VAAQIGRREAQLRWPFLLLLRCGPQLTPPENPFPSPFQPGPLSSRQESYPALFRPSRPTALINKKGGMPKRKEKRAGNIVSEP